jgi:hypothetical protein
MPQLGPQAPANAASHTTSADPAGSGAQSSGMAASKEGNAPLASRYAGGIAGALELGGAIAAGVATIPKREVISTAASGALWAGGAAAGMVGNTASLVAGIGTQSHLSVGSLATRIASHAGQMISGVANLGAGVSDATTASRHVVAKVAGGFSGGAWGLSAGLNMAQAGTELWNGYSHASALKFASGGFNLGAAIADTVAVFDATASVAPKVASALWAAGAAAQVGAAIAERPAKKPEDVESGTQVSE